MRAVCDLGLDVDSILVITFTNNAAAELRSRIRAALTERGRPDLAQQLHGAWVSTIHSFCGRLLRTYPLAVGIDPGFRELAGEHGAVLRGEACERALERFVEGSDPEKLRLLATYGSGTLRRRLTGVYEKLRSSARPLVLAPDADPHLDEELAAWKAEAEILLADPAATDNQREAARSAIELVPRIEVLIDLRGQRVSGQRGAAYEEARKRVEQAALNTLALTDLALLQELLELFAAEYAAGKERESALDFEDLQLIARDLLAGNDAVREAEQLRFRAIMVDEFQDTNALQCELVDLLAGGPPKDVFTVGDEFQSIYGFRDADLEVFRSRRESAAQRLPLTRNYRSRAEVLAAVNYLFAPEFGDDFQPLTASGDFPDPVFGHPVELLVTDKESYKGSGEHWRRAEARHIARRVRELVDTGAAEPSEIVLLFQAGTDAEGYEEELRALGLPTYRSTGRRYFGQQQVVDLMMYLRLLWNRYDDEAVAAVLASPFVGVSNDALVLIRRHAGRRPLFTGIERSLPEALDRDDVRLLRAFRQRFERLVAASARVSLERLCELVVSEHDYDLAVLARADGARRYANLRKLMRLARSYEELRGRDLEGFVRFIFRQEALGASQVEAVSEEGGNSIRLLTIHAAKGLEFKVVVVADAGREGVGPAPADEILALADGRFGFQLVDPVTGRNRPVFDYEEVRSAKEAAEVNERLRLYYVAMTRASERLIVSGAADESEKTPIGWVLDRLQARAELEQAEGTFELERDGATFVVQVDRHMPAEDLADGDEAAAALALEAGQLALFDQIPDAPIPRGYRLPELAPIPQPPLHRVRRLSFSALALFERCSYRYYAERVGRLRERPAERGTGGGLAATEIGDAVHRLLELVDPAAPVAPELDPVRGWYPAVSEEELERIGGHVAAYCGSGLAQRLAGLDGVRPERPFAFEHDGVLLHGRLDLLQFAGTRAIVVDYKTNVLGERSPEEIVEHGYRLQRLVYALACLKAGAEEVEVVYTFLERPEEPVATVFTTADAPTLEAELSAAIGRIAAGVFVPQPSDFTCSGCPALDVVCAGPRLRGGPVAEPPAEYATA